MKIVTLSRKKEFNYYKRINPLNRTIQIMYLKRCLYYIQSMLMISLAVFSIGCNKNVLYESTQPSESAETKMLLSTEHKQKVLMPDDKITVSIWNHEDISVGSIHELSIADKPNDKWVMVNSAGEVNLPKIGKVKVAGLTVQETTKKLEKAYIKYITNPIINIQVLSNKITVLGEVKNPGTYLISSESYRLVDIIGRCSGFTDFAKPSAIKIVRGNKSFKVDLTNTSFNETIIYADDVVYIPPTSKKGIEKSGIKILPIIGLLSVFTLIYLVATL